MAWEMSWVEDDHITNGDVSSEEANCAYAVSVISSSNIQYIDGFSGNIADEGLLSESPSFLTAQSCQLSLNTLQFTELLPDSDSPRDNLGPQLDTKINLGMTRFVPCAGKQTQEETFVDSREDYQVATPLYVFNYFTQNTLTSSKIVGGVWPGQLFKGTTVGDGLES